LCCLGTFIALINPNFNDIVDVHMKKLLGVVGAAALMFCLGVAPAKAELLTRDVYAPGDQKAVSDTVSGLDWLSLTETFGMSVDSVKAQLGAGGLFEGWRLPDAGESFAILAQIFEGVPSTTTNIYGAEYNAMSETWKQVFGAVDGANGNFMSFGLFFSRAGGSYKIAGVDYYNGVTSGATGYSSTGVNGAFSNPYYGVFLVRDTPIDNISEPTDVPAPAMLWVVALVAGLMSRRASMRAQSV